MARMATLVAASGAATPADAIRAAVDAWLEVSGDPEVRQLILLDAPVVLGWAGFRDVAQRYSLGMTEQLITEAIRAGQLARQPVRPLAQVLIGALDEAAMFIATADDPKRARRETRQVLRRLIDGCLTAALGAASAKWLADRDLSSRTGRRTGWSPLGGEACPFRCQVAVPVEAAQGNQLDSFARILDILRRCGVHERT